MDEEAGLLDRLLAQGLLIEMGVDGLYGRSALFERIVEGLDALITRHGQADGAEVVRFPPGLDRRSFEESEYLESFPQLAGTVHSFCGGDHEHRLLLNELEVGADWTGGQVATDIVLTPAACYPVYPMVAKQGPLPPEGRLIDVCSYCFRHEPSLDPARMQMFRMREYVRIGTPQQVTAFRAEWLARGRRLIESLGLPLTVEVANDPFFGRAGRLMASSQREQKLKFELLVPVDSIEKPTACLSFNYHAAHFGDIWRIRAADGGIAHTACVGFGMERVTLALLRNHGLDVAGWPKTVRDALGL
jgi:seryl-tRNA synthetase